MTDNKDSIPYSDVAQEESHDQNILRDSAPLPFGSVSAHDVSWLRNHIHQEPNCGVCAVEMVRCERIYLRHKERINAFCESDGNNIRLHAKALCQFYMELKGLTEDQAEELVEQLHHLRLN